MLNCLCTFVARRRGSALLVMIAAAADVRADLPAVAFDGGDISRALLGDGTGVILGIVDSGRPTRRSRFWPGTIRWAKPRLVAQENFVNYETKLRTGCGWHGTAVAGIILANGTATNAGDSGFAPDARYVNARVLDSNTSFLSDDQVVNGVAFCAGESFGRHQPLARRIRAAVKRRESQLDLLTDMVVDHYGVFVSVAAGNSGPTTSAA